MTTRTFMPSGPDIVSEEFEGEFVLLNLTSGQYFGLNPAASEIWRSLVANMGFGPSQPDTIIQFIEDLIQLGLVIEAPASPVLEVEISGGAPEIQAFDDLADLIMADPIHDVDEQTGWPVSPAPSDQK